MSEFVISTRYANALLAISEEKNSFQEVIADISLVKNTLEGSKDLKIVLSNPIINSKTKASILKEVFNLKVGEVVGNFLQFVVDKGRENILFDICNRFGELINEKLNQVNIAITSAIELSELQKKEIEEKLTKIINKNLITDYKINNKIIGGFKAKYNDTVIDASIEHQLELLKKVLFQEDYLKN